jgi:peptidoglycan/LPS O-acetylase OafA/YrhL
MQRYHALDSLRASMMLLGVWLHTVVGYSLDGGWPYKDAHPTAAFDWTLSLIHTFRMPVFMVMAGFFGALLWVRRGDRAFAENRIRRILLPFVLGWLAVYPVSVFMSAWSKTSSLAASARFFTSGELLEHLHPGHLWFLEYLLVLYAIASVGVKVIERLPSGLLRQANDLYRRALRSPWRPVLFAIPYFAALSLMRGGYLEDPPGFVPVPRIVLAYLVPFAFGWLLYLNRDLLPSFEHRAWSQVGLAAAIFVAYGLGLASLLEGLGLSLIVIRAALGALVLWLITFGMTGLFLRYASKESPRWRYLSDGSYWMYTVHMPVVMAFQMMLAGVAIPTEAKVFLVVGLSAVVLVASYDLVARPTWIGVLLNGRRYPRRLFVRPERVVGTPYETPEIRMVSPKL